MEPANRTEAAKAMVAPAERVCLVGAASLLGWGLLCQGFPAKWTAVSGPRSRFRRPVPVKKIRFERPSELLSAVSAANADLVIYCAGVCDVDRCEADSRWARQINVESLRRLLNWLPQSTRLVYCSSDHVFSGDCGPYSEDSPTDPITVYGHTRVEAESLVRRARPDSIIIRFGLGIGESANGKTGHLNWLKYRTARRLPTTVVRDEYRSAVWLSDLSRRVWALAQSKLAGTRHIAATRATSRLELAHYLNRRFQLGARIQVECRKDRPLPHLGKVELTSKYHDRLAAPLESVVDDGEHV